MELSVTKRARAILPVRRKSESSGCSWGIRPESFRGVSEMEDDVWFQSLRKRLQPAQPTREVSRRKHLREDDVILANV